MSNLDYFWSITRSLNSRKCSWTELPEKVQHKTFPESLQTRRIQESCRSRQSGKCFHLQQQVNLFRILLRRKTFDIIVASASCSGLAEKTSELFIRRSTDWLWPREERKGNIGIHRLWFACGPLYNALKRFFVSTRSRKSKSCRVESLELAAEEKYWSLEV